MPGLPRVYVSVDGGGTHTRAGLFDAFGRELVRTEVAASNPHRVGVEAATLALREALLGLGSVAAGEQVEGVAIGLAGRSHPEAASLLGAACRAAPGSFLAAVAAAPLRLLREDGELARAAAFRGSAGVLLLAGTGSAAWGTGPLGAVRCGGLGPSVGDEGSGHALGMAALRAAASHFDATGSAPSWLAALTQVPVRGFESALRGGELRAADLAPLVLELAAVASGETEGQCGDRALLLQVRHEAVAALVHLGETAARRVGLLNAPVATAGSVAEALRVQLLAHFGERLASHVRDALPGGFWLLQHDRSVPPEW